jgi:hypothetical protein
MRIGKGNPGTRIKPAPVPLCPPQIPYDLTWARTRAAVLRSRRLTARAVGITISDLRRGTRFFFFFHFLYSGSSDYATYSTPVFRANDTQNISHILWNPKLDYRLHKSPELNIILSLKNAVRTLISNSFNIYFNITIIFTPGLTNVFSFTFF